MTPDEARRIVAALEGVIGPGDGQVSDWRAIRLLEDARRLLAEAEREARPTGATLVPPAGMDWITQQRLSVPPTEEDTPSATARRLVKRAEELAGRPCADPSGMAFGIDILIRDYRAAEMLAAPSAVLRRVKAALERAQDAVDELRKHPTAIAHLGRLVRARDAGEVQDAHREGRRPEPFDAFHAGRAAASAAMNRLADDVRRVGGLWGRNPAGEVPAIRSPEAETMAGLALMWRMGMDLEPEPPRNRPGARQGPFVVWAEEAAREIGGDLATRSIKDLWGNVRSGPRRRPQARG